VSVTPPRGILVDYGGTLVEEAGFDARAGVELLLAHVTHRPPSLGIEDVLARVERVTREVSARRDAFQIEAPWLAVTRLIYDYFGLTFDQSLSELELEFWNATVTTRPMAGAREALVALESLDIPFGVVSNSSFHGTVIRHELAKHHLAAPFVVASADYAVRKPNPLLFETAASLLDVAPRDIWFVGDRLDTDVAGARSAGMMSVWLRPPNDARASEADLTVSSWDELLQHVRAMRL
jgi:putative hydrolase of the HAD superfamily